VALVAHEIHDHGGMEKALAELIRVGRGHVNFVVVSRYLAPDLRHLVDWRRVPAPNRPFPLKFSLFFVLAGARLRAVRADVVHTMGAIVPNRADVATVQFCHAAHRQIALRASIDRRPALRRLNTAISSLLSVVAERWLYRPSRTRALAAVSRGVARELRERYPCVSVLLTPNGVDLERFRPDPDVRRAFRATHGVGTGEVVALFVGGDWERKGPAIAIRAVARATREAPLRLWVVGRGDEERLGRVAAEHGVEDRVSFFGPRADSERFFQAADVFVFPSAYEGFPLALLEAAASALPLVVTATNGVDELVGDGSCGIVVQRTTDSVARALVRLANSPELRAELGIAARAQAQEFTWQRSVESVIDSYSRLLPSSMVIPEPV